MKASLTRFYPELHRRGVIRAAALYMVMAFVTVQVVDAVFPYIALPTNAGTLVIVLLALGFPVSIGVAWALELTPEGFRRELTRQEAVALASASDALVVPKELRPDSVAVLPFENLSTEPDNEYFSDGITGDIIASTARIRGLRVLSRMSVMKYKGAGRDISAIAGELGVATVVAGSVRRSGSRVRIVAEVVDAREDDHLWSETYDRELEDIFQVQSEVAAQVALAVERELSTSDRNRIEVRGTTDPEAYDLYLRARFLWNQRSDTAVAESVHLYRRALEHDPDFALAHSALADAFTILGIYGTRAPREVLPAARAEGEAALAIDPTLGEAMAARACVIGIFDWDWATADQEFKRATEHAPSYATGHQWYAMNVLAPQGKFTSALHELECARDLNPASVAISASLGILSFYARDFTRATSEFEAVIQLHPRFALAHYSLGQCHEQCGRIAEGLESLKRAVRLSGEISETLAVYGHALALRGDLAEAETVRQRLLERSTKQWVSPVLIAQTLIGLGETDHALDHLEEATEARAADLVWLGVRPVYDPLRESDRFKRIVSKLGIEA